MASVNDHVLYGQRSRGARRCPIHPVLRAMVLTARLRLQHEPCALFRNYHHRGGPEVIDGITDASITRSRFSRDDGDESRSHAMLNHALPARTLRR